MSQPPDVRPGVAADGTPPQILVIDDDAAIDEGFGELLGLAGYLVHAESSRTAALAYLETATPSAVILDLHLPDGTGVDCLRELRAMPRHKHLPVAILTGDYFLDEHMASELEQLGARVFFKPVWVEDLLRIVRELSVGQSRDGAAAGAVVTQQQRNEP
jgi:DNA-binding response OmpR family regulator